jgi:DNA repair protein RadC
MSEDRPKYGGLGAATTRCRRAVGDRGMELCVTLPKTPGPKITGPDDVCRLLRPVAAKQDRESFFVVALSITNEVLGIEEAHRGSLAGVEVHPREVFKGAMLANAASVVIAHNHPSQNLEPSKDDFALTKRLAKSGRLLGVPVLDHLILGAKSCTSIRDLRPKLFRDEDDDFD